MNMYTTIGIILSIFITKSTMKKLACEYPPSDLEETDQSIFIVLWQGFS